MAARQTSSSVNNKNTSYISFLHNFEKYMVTPELFNKFENSIAKPSVITSQQNVVQNTKNQSRYNNDRVFIREYDKLFWCFYLIYDSEQYELIDRKVFQTEKQMKIDLIEKIRKNVGPVKEAKLKLCDLESNMVNDKLLGLDGFQAFCIYYGLNVIVCYNHIYHHFHNDDDLPTSIVYIIGNQTYCEKDVSPSKLSEIKDKYFFVSNSKKPLKSIGTYKTDDLVQICKQMKIVYYDDAHKTYKKTQLYELISKKMN